MRNTLIVTSAFLLSVVAGACTGTSATPGKPNPAVGPAGAGAPERPTAPGAPQGGTARGPGGPGGPVPVTVTTVASKPAPVEIEVIGSVEPLSTVSVRAQITGELTSVQFREGDDVAKGQVLFTLDRRPLEAALAQAEANLARDTAQAANARAQAVRYQDLAQRGIATKEQVDTTRTAATALDAVLEADRATVENAKVQLQYATIPAPLSGRTGALMVHPGSLIRANDAAPLVVINQVAPVSVAFSVPERRLTELKQYLAKGPVAVHAQIPGSTGPDEGGRVSFVDNAIDRTTGTIRVKATFDNRSRLLWPGQFVNVTVTLATVQDATTVPSVAVQTGPQGTFVYVIKADQSAEVRKVTVERTRGDESIIATGLQPGETIVTDGQLRLTPGSRVSIKKGAEGGRS
ncbi:MAG: efflux RND transporter periplasmic adaptor subunit [Vicinamibacterales bacterium]